VVIKNKLNKMSEQEVANERKKQASTKETLRTQELMLEKMQSKTVGKAGYDDLTKDIEKYQAKVKKGIALTKQEVHSLKMLETQTAQNRNMMDQLANSYMLISGLRQVMRGFRKEVSYLRELDQAVYNLGVVSGITANQTEDLKFKLLDMASEFPTQATKIARAMDTIGRTGLSFADNIGTIDNVIKLAISSGSELNETAGIIAKTMVSFSLDSTQAANAIDYMHSVVLKSPLTLESLNSSLANSANSFATLLEFTSKSSQELQTYQEELLRLDLALTGGLARIGEMNADVKLHEMLEHRKVA